MRSLRCSLVVAEVTLLEALRNRILMVAVAFAVALVGISVTAASVSMGERARLIVDIGLAAASALGSIIAIALTVASFGREIERHTAYPVLARPVPRWAFVLGKYVGVLGTMLTVVTLMLLATAGAVWLYGGRVPSAFWPSIWLNWLEMSVVTGVALLFTSNTGPVLASAFAVGAVVAGNFVDDLRTLADGFAHRGEPAVAAALKVAYQLLPDLQALSLRTQAANDLPVPTAFVVWGTLYSAAYAATVVVLAMIVFERRRAL